MKKAYIILTSFFTLVTLFSLCYFISFRITMTRFGNNSGDRSDGVIFEANNNSNANQLNSQNQVDPNMTAIQADTSKKDTITPFTKYKLQTYDIITDTMTVKELAVPDTLLGQTRETLMEYLNNYMSELPLEEYQKGLLSYELISFSDDEVILRKTYNSDNLQYKYYIVVENGLLTVYYSDKKTVFEYTQIKLEDLPEAEQLKLNHGIYIKDKAELYGILENYSS